jgi:NTP pyrophosphatase (non-canonical NTP hydrolase)
MVSNEDQLRVLRDRLRVFAEQRDWNQFHTPKNLAMAVAAESGELLEHFQWLTSDESGALSDETRSRVAEEIADVLLYLIRLADKLDLDMYEAALEKIEKNGEKYPVEKSRGNARKYDQL